MRVNWDREKNKLLMRTRGIGFEDALGVFDQEYIVQTKNDDPEQYKAIGFTKSGILISLIAEIRFDQEGEYHWLVTLWKATKSEANIYEQNF
jgi:uncharacterized DUF497 family protein